jgi:Transglutaminase-like superfamily
MTELVVKSYLLLMRIEFCMLFWDIRVLHELVRRKPVGVVKHDRRSSEDLSHAMDWACVLYPKKVMCLQRSAATTLLLRRHGFKAEMVIGAQILPFRSHAWVEIGGVVVNDKPYIPDIYRFLERC